MGAEIVKPVATVSGLDRIPGMILHHHERFDGAGYPYALKGERIPFGARVIAVADTLSAMASNRPYRKAIEFNRIIQEIEACSGTQFDPVVVDAFMGITDQIKNYFLQGSVFGEGPDPQSICVSEQSVLVHQ